MINKKNIQNNLYAELEFVGFRVSHSEQLPMGEIPDIEHVIIKACYEVDKDGRILGLLLSWLMVHGSHIIADKLFKEYEMAKKYLGECPWFYAICAFRSHLKDHRFKKGLVKLKNPHYFGGASQSSLIRIKGCIDYLEKLNIFVATTSLRIREEDVLTIDELLKKNEQYRNRYIWGVNWRAEIIGLVLLGAKTPGEIAKRLGLARSRVGIVFKEYTLIKRFMVIVR
ncbi:MAG: hypothetical protein HQK53_19250 [Oligoflexia bacterium]|nr:hypothetical protein [Oligoflexia bacterium]